LNDPADLRIISRLSMDYVVSIYSAILRAASPTRRTTPPPPQSPVTTKL
jgi:hypothetical protein